MREFDYAPENIKDEEEVRNLYLETSLGERGYDVYQLISDSSYARRSVLREWLKEHDFDPDQILAFEDREITAPERPAQDKRAINACLRLWLHEMGEDAKKVEDDGLWALAEKVMRS